MNGLVQLVLILVVLAGLGIGGYYLYKDLSQKPINSPCTSNDDCKNKSCGRQTAASGSQLICCPSNAIDTFGGYDYCTGMPAGSVCWSDDMCAGPTSTTTGNCKGNLSGLQKGVCETS